MKLDLDFFENSVTGLELTLDSEGKYSINFCVLKKSKGQLSILQSGAEIPGLEELFKLIDKNNPLIISVNGKGIIHKKINRLADEGMESILQKVLPGGKAEDFFIQLYDIDKQGSFAGIARRNLLEQILNEFSQKEYKIIGVALGPFLVHSLLPVLSNADVATELEFSYCKLAVRNNQIEQYIQLPSPSPVMAVEYKGFTIKSDQIVAYSGALSYFNPVSQLTNNDNSIDNRLEEYKNELQFKKYGSYILAFFLTVLLINFSVFSYLSDEVKLKSAGYALVSSKLILMDSLQKQVEERSGFLSKSGLSDPSRASFYADQIAKDLPSSILLTSINIQPLKKNDDDRKKREFETGKILVEGKTKFAMDVNEWTKLMKAYPWVGSVNLQNFKQKEGDNQGEFVLEVKLK